ncbi:hypothetical protein J4Q44_G00188160 [Coregonus suidteri]|uniref:Uncharacterized protein n=1 Tax=Coregonus suidteri TaxID=861788 RepID=A0AAN8QTN1_9TELE
MKRRKAPVETWSLFDVHIRYTRETYDEARRKLPMAVVHSDLQTEEDDHPAYMKRKERGTNRQITSENDSEDESEPIEKPPRNAQSKTTKGQSLPPAPVIRPPQCSRETPVRVEPLDSQSIQQQPLPVLCEILTSLDTRKQQQLILLQLQRLQLNGSTPSEVPDVTDLGLPLSSLEYLKRVEGTIAGQPDLK